MYRARDERRGRDLALKILSSDLIGDPERFRREIRAVAALQHPNLLSVYDVGQDDPETYFLVMEPLDGETLRTRLQRGPLPRREALDIAVQVAQGLAAAHERGLVHRDLKPENIFLTRGAGVKILDFGLAGGVASTRGPIPSTDAGTVLGTMGYMSPEQIKGELVDGPTDVFSLGVVLYEMITGTNPFIATTVAESFRRPLKASPLPSTDNPFLDRIIAECLDENPTGRPTAAQLVERLKLLPNVRQRLGSKGEPMSDIPPTPPEPSSVNVEPADVDPAGPPVQDTQLPNDLPPPQSRPVHASDAVTSAAITYGTQLLYELHGLPKIDAQARAVYMNLWNAEVPTWGLLSAAEAALLRLLPVERLRRRAWFVRDQFADVTDSTKVSRYLASSPPDAEKGEELSLRADLLEVHREIARYYTFGRAGEHERGLLVRRILRLAAILLLGLTAVLLSVVLQDSVVFWIVITASLGVAVIAAIVSYFFSRKSRVAPLGPGFLVLAFLCGAALGQDPPATNTAPVPTATVNTSAAPSAKEQPTADEPEQKPEQQKPEQQKAEVDLRDRQPVVGGIPTILMVAFAGVLGATFSILQRAQRTGTGGDPMLSLLALRSAREHVLLSILSGGIASLVTYAIFAGGMLEGSLFPRMVGDGQEVANKDLAMRFLVFFRGSGPDEFIDHGKLLVWAFVSGFAERFVPDILDRFAGAAKK